MSELKVVFGKDSVTIVGDLDRREAEGLGLDLRAIAKRYGLTVSPVRVERHEPRPPARRRRSRR